MKMFTKDVISDEGRISVEKQMDMEAYPVHVHDFIELVYVTAGNGTLFAG